MTIRAYIESKFKPFGINFSEADFADISMTIDLDDELTNDNRNDVFKALVETVIPQLLLRAKSINEDGFSISHDNEALLQYYAWLCAKLDMIDQLNKVATITDVSHLF